MLRSKIIVVLSIIIHLSLGQNFYALQPSNYYMAFPGHSYTINLPLSYKLYPLQSPSYKLFAANIFSAIAEQESMKNIVFSPISIQTALALTYLGAQGQTAEDLSNVLQLGQGDKTQVAKNFGDFQRTLTNSKQNKAPERPQLKIANRMYVAKNKILKTKFNSLAEQYLGAKALQLDFTNRQQAALEINNWIAKETENLIHDIVKPDAFNDYTALVLVNAIYFKAKWLYAFSKILTQPRNFQLKSKKQQIVETMYNEANYKYAEIPELNAKAIELPYENSNISMLIILPNEVEGLEDLEHKLKYMDLNVIYSKMTIECVQLYLPKFRIEYEIDLKEPLQKLGLSSIFTPTANFEDLLATAESLYISKAVHKAFLEVNESGSEAGAATFSFIQAYAAGNPFSKEFRADHPFMFAIRSDTAVYFSGHVAKF